MFQITPPKLSMALLASALSFPLTTGCGDDDDGPKGSATGGTSGKGGTGGSTAAPETPGKGGADNAAGQANGASAGVGGDNAEPERALYAVITQAGINPDFASYIALTDDLERDETLSIDGAIEVVGRAFGAGVPGSGRLFVGSNGSGKITRYDLKDEALVAGPSVSFEGVGTTSIGEYAAQLQVISDTRAYYFDGKVPQVVVWNPEEMVIEDTVSLADLAEPDTALSFTSTAPVRAGDSLVMPAGWRVGTDTIPSFAGVVVVDLGNDNVKVVRHDERCGYVRDAVAGPDGKIYMATEAFGAAAWHLDDSKAPEPCLLRFDPKTSSFDEDFNVPLSSIVNGGTAGSLVASPSGTAYLRVLDPSYEVPTDLVPRGLASAPVWDWYAVELGDTPTATRVENAPQSMGSVLLVSTGSQTFVPRFDAESATTEFIEFTDGFSEPALRVPGNVFSMVRLR